MAVRTPMGRDRSSTLCENNYDPQLPKDMFGFPVDNKYLSAYQDFMVTHLQESIKQNEKITDAIQQGVIDTSLPKTQWGVVKHITVPKKPTVANNRPLLKKLMPRTSSSMDVLSVISHRDREAIKEHSNKDKEKDKADDRRKSFIRSKSITNLLTGKPDPPRENHSWRDKPEVAEVRPLRSRSTSENEFTARPHFSSPPTSPGILQYLIDLTSDSPEENVRNIIRGGIPVNYRAELWTAMSGITLKLPVVKGVYKTLLEGLDKPRFLDSIAYEQIEKDLTRTFPGIEFTPSGHEFQPILRRILRAYAIRNPALGYCQSMNFVAGGLLIFMEEEHAFWVLTWIVEELLHGYFTKTMVGLQVDTALFDKLLKKYMPELSKHLTALGFSPVMCTVQWFLCMFLNSLPSEASFRVWDLIFFTGTKVLFEVGLNIMRMYEMVILKKNDPVEIASFLNRSLSSMFDVTPLLAQNFLKNVTPDEIKTMQLQLHAGVQAELRGRHDTLQMIELLRLTKFNRPELTTLYQEFVTLDPMLNEFGINIYIFRNIIPTAFPTWNKPDEYFSQKLFEAFDSDNDALVDFKDLMLGLSAIFRGSVKDKMSVCCKLFGASASGRVRRGELHKLLFSLYKVVENSPDNQVQREVNFFTDMFFKHDKNDEGITIEKFKEFALLQPAVVKCFNLTKPNANQLVSLAVKTRC